MMYLSEIKDGKHSLTEVDNPVFEKEYDVIVCGLGTAGSLAALFSAENDLSVLGIETLTCAGGTHSAAGITQHYFGYPGGRYEDIDKEVDSFAEQYTCTKAESRKIVTEAMLVEQGVEILYETSVCGIYLEEKTVVGIKAITEKGLINFKAKILMDCTADAHLAHMSGCATEFGRKSDGQAQPYTMASLTFVKDRYDFTNFDSGRVDQSDDKSLSDALIFSRAFEKKEEKWGGRQFIAHVPLIGLREGRRIVAEESVNVKDLFEDKQTETPMFFSYADLDKHGLDVAFDGEELCDWAIGSNLGAYNLTVAVPYRAILPKGFDGILVPCRAIGVSREISCCVRMIPDMKKMAEAAAEWSALAIKQNQKLREVPYEQLKEKLIKSGCLNLSENYGCRVDGQVNWDGKPLIPKKVSFITDPKKLKKGLKSETPGEAIWSARRMGESAVPTLRKLLTSRNKNIAKHSAFALANLGNDEGKSLLHKMVKERDCLMLKDCRKKNNLRGCMAIYWLGRLADEESVDILTELISGENEFDNPIYHQSNPMLNYYSFDFNGVYFQFMSQSVMALIRIGNAHEHLRPKISEAFSKAFLSDEYYNRITKRPQKCSEGNMALTIKNFVLSAIEEWKVVNYD